MIRLRRRTYLIVTQSFRPILSSNRRHDGLEQLQNILSTLLEILQHHLQMYRAVVVLMFPTVVVGDRRDACVAETELFRQNDLETEQNNDLDSRFISFKTENTVASWGTA